LERVDPKEKGLRERMKYIGALILKWRN